MRKPHLDLLALPARLLEGFRVGQRADAITHLLIDIAGDLAHNRRRALRLQGAGRAVVLAGPVVDDMALINVASAGQLRARASSKTSRCFTVCAIESVASLAGDASGFEWTECPK